MNHTNNTINLTVDLNKSAVGRFVFTVLPNSVKDTVVLKGTINYASTLNCTETSIVT